MSFFLIRGVLLEIATTRFDNLPEFIVGSLGRFEDIKPPARQAARIG
jgi:hypothetical protein